MSGIVCAIRGGPASQHTIDRSVNIAAEKEQPLYFLYVINLNFLTHTATSRVHTITREMYEMGDFILTLAKGQAESRGVQAEGFIRQGIVSEEIIALSHEVDADYVVMGKPKGEQDADVFTHERIEIFMTRLSEECGAQVILVERDTS